jgi:hypothetical protein
MLRSKKKAEASGASQLSEESFETAQRLEADARDLYDEGRFGEASAKLFETSGLYLSASIEADSEKAARENRARLELERQQRLRRTEAEKVRSSYEQDLLSAAKADSETQAPRQFREALRLASEARAKWDRDDYAGSTSDYEKAAQLMKDARTAALAAPPVPESEVAPIAANLAPADSPKSTPEENAVEISRAAIDGVLQQYVSCLQAKNLKKLKSIWPSLAGPQEQAIQEEFKNAQKIQAEFADVDLKIDGDSAIVTARRTYVLQTVDGQNLHTDTRTVMSLRKDNGSWHIQTMRFEPIQ